MKPVFQTDFGSKTGNCWPAVIASIFELPQDMLCDIPNFCVIGGDEWAALTNNWLNTELGFYFFTVPAGKGYDEEGNIIPGLEFIPSGFHGISGIGPRGVWHSCVGYNGKIIHDPFPNSTGNIQIKVYDIFVPLNPARKILDGREP